MNWTDAEISALKTFTQNGWTASQIASRLHKTRNAVVGKWHRLGDTVPGRVKGPGFVWNQSKRVQLQKMWLLGYTPDQIAEKLEVSTMAVTTKISRMRGKQTIKTKQTPKARAVMPLPEPPAFSAETVLFRDHDSHQCHYIVGDPKGPDTLYCADARFELSSYCATHTLLCKQSRCASL